MSYIEGFGDEVIQFFGIVLIICLGVIAWWSTNIRDLPQVRTVLIVERRSPRLFSRTQSNISQNSERLNSEQSIPDICQENTLTVAANSASKSELPAGTAALNEDENACSNTNSDVDNEIVTKLKNNGSKADNSQDVQPQESQEQNQPNCTDTDNIRIRLKYLNDDQKLVEGRLQELLGDFKRRHFSMELAAQKFVRLIFNGHVLQRDDQTLQGCGLYDNCVVHCLVHTQQNNNRSNSSQHMNSPPQDWNLGGLLYACLSLILGVAWICRYNYSHLFTLTTTTALVGLTGMFAVSVIGLYMPDQEQPSSSN